MAHSTNSSPLSPSRYEAEGGVPQLLLASASQRRSWLLRQHGYDFLQDPAEVEEVRRPSEPAAAYVERLAREKCRAAMRRGHRHVVSGDTTIEFEGTILEKPVDLNDARDTLHRLSNESVVALTGLTLGSHFDSRCWMVTSVVRSTVHFRNFSEDDVERYILTDEPLGKAGSFAIQGLGWRLIDEVEGCFNNVVGLPMCELRVLARAMRHVHAGPFTPCHSQQQPRCPREALPLATRWLWDEEVID